MPYKMHILNASRIFVYALVYADDDTSATKLDVKYTWGHYHNPLQWRHNGRHGVSNHQHHDCLLNRLFRQRSKKTSKLRVTGLCEGNSPVTGEFPTQMDSKAKNVAIMRHYATLLLKQIYIFGSSLPVNICWLIVFGSDKRLCEVFIPPKLLQL